MRTPEVSVIMITYGHEKYIEEAINGVLMQKCNFDIELIIANDASPDNSDQIIKKELAHSSNELSIRYINREVNIGMIPNLIDAIKQSCGKYIAMCEGDDYWIDDSKLQKQVEFLEKNEGYTFCTHRYKVYSEFSKAFENEIHPHIFEPYDTILNGVIINKDVFHTSWMTQPLTALIKKETWLEIVKERKKFTYFRDFHFFYLLLKHGNGFCMNFVGGVYRMHENGIYSGINNVERNKTALLIYEELYRYSKDKSFFLAYWNAIFILIKKRKHIDLVLKSFFLNLGIKDKLKATRSLLTFMNINLVRKLKR